MAAVEEDRGSMRRGAAAHIRRAAEAAHHILPEMQEAVRILVEDTEARTVAASRVAGSMGTAAGGASERLHPSRLGAARPSRWFLGCGSTSCPPESALRARSRAAAAAAAAAEAAVAAHSCPLAAPRRSLQCPGCGSMCGHRHCAPPASSRLVVAVAAEAHPSRIAAHRWRRGTSRRPTDEKTAVQARTRTTPQELTMPRHSAAAFVGRHSPLASPRLCPRRVPLAGPTRSRRSACCGSTSGHRKPAPRATPTPRAQEVAAASRPLRLGAARTSRASPRCSSTCVHPQSAGPSRPPRPTSAARRRVRVASLRSRQGTTTHPTCAPAAAWTRRRLGALAAAAAAARHSQASPRRARVRQLRPVDPTSCRPSPCCSSTCAHRLPEPLARARAAHRAPGLSYPRATRGSSRRPTLARALPRESTWRSRLCVAACAARPATASTVRLRPELRDGPTWWHRCPCCGSMSGRRPPAPRARPSRPRGQELSRPATRGTSRRPTSCERPC